MLQNFRRFNVEKYKSPSFGKYVQFNKYRMKQQILTAFQATLVPDSQTVRRGAAALGQLAKLQGYCLALMEIIDDGSLNPFIRQAGLAQLKQSIDKRWQPLKFVKQPKQPQVLISPAQKAKIKEYLLPAFIRCKGDRRFLKLYKNIVTLVAGYEWKEWLPIHEIILGLQTVECNAVLQFLLAIETMFELSVKEERDVFDKFIATVFPVLLELGKRCCPSATVPPSLTFALICKCFWKGIHMEMSPYVRAEELAWMSLFKDVLSYNNMEFVLTQDKDSIAYFYFNIKKTVTRILCKFYQKHANWRFQKKLQSYGNQWHSKYSQTFLQLLYSQLTVPNLQKTHCFCMKSFTSLSYFRPKLAEPYVPHLLYSTLLPFLRLTPEDQSLAKSDPMEFLRKQQDYSMESPNTKVAATDLWCAYSAVEENGSGKYVVKNVEFLIKKLEEANLVEKEMAMYLMCKLRMSLSKNAEVKKHLAAILEKYIVPELNSQILFLRARAMDIFISYGNMNFENTSIIQNAVQQIFFCVANDTNALVQIKAACAFNQVLKHQKALDIAKPYLSKILEVYVRLIDKYDLQELVISLQGIVEHFSKEIGPYAIELTKHLSQLFVKYCKGDLEKIEESDYHGELEHAAGGVVMAIKQIIDSKLSQECMQAIQEYVANIVGYSFTIQGCDYVQDTLKLLSSYLYHAKTPYSARIWFFYPTIIYSLIGAPQKVPLPIPAYIQHQPELMQNIKKPYNSENFQYILPVICNYINKGLLTIIQEKDYFETNMLELTFKLIEKTYRKYSPDAIMDLTCCTTILLYLLENTRPIGPAIAFIFQIVKFNVEYVHSKTVRTMNAQLIANSLFNTPQIVSLYSKDNLCDKVFPDLQRYSQFLIETWQVKRLVLGLSSFIVVPNKPQNLKKYVEPLFKLLIKKVLDAGNERLQDQSIKTASSQGDQIDDDDMVQSLQSQQLYFQEDYENIFPSRTSQLDQLSYFQQCLKIIQEQQAQVYTQLMKLITESQLNQLKVILAKVKPLQLQPQAQKKA